jgi:hypothetical protein
MSSPAHTIVLELTPTGKAILRVLLYFDIWSYPLTEEEILRYLPLPAQAAGDIHASLLSLEAHGAIFRQGTFWGLRPDPTQPDKRLQGNAHCAERMVTARRFSRLIGNFPWVRGVCLSGSISKGTMDADADIDYFILTAPGRLWLSRTLLILFKKVILLNSRRNFCVNYFLDTNHLAIRDHNLFTATEAITLIPTVNGQLYLDFLKANEWMKDFYPNFEPRSLQNCFPARRRGLKWFWETFTPGFLASAMDTWCMRQTKRRWKSKFAHFGEDKLKTALASEKNVSKHHPQDFRNKVLVELEAKTTAFEKQFNTSLSHG